MNKEILEFGKELADFLNISCPEIVQLKNARTSTANGLYDGKKIYIKEGIPLPDQLYAVAHEIRHVWQKNTGFSFEGYIEDGNINLEDFNKQAAEIDAHAFAKIAMVDSYGISPLYNETTDDFKKLVDERIKEIISNEFRTE